MSVSAETTKVKWQIMYIFNS